LQGFEHSISQVSPSFYRSKKTKHFNLIQKLSAVFLWIELLIRTALAYVVYLLLRNTSFIRSAVWVSKLFKKKLAVEMYISLYDTFVQDRELIKGRSKEAKSLRNKDRLALTKPDFIIYASNHELNYWKKILDISIDPCKFFCSSNL